MSLPTVKVLLQERCTLPILEVASIDACRPELATLLFVALDPRDLLEFEVETGSVHFGGGKFLLR